MNKNYKIGILAASVAIVLISVLVYRTYSPEAVFRTGLATAFWLSLENDGREITLAPGETKTVPVELHHWKELDTALYVELVSNEGNSNMDNYPDGLSVSFDLDASVISLSKGAVAVQSKNYEARFNPPMVKQVSSDGQMFIREIGNLTVTATENVPPDVYYFGLSTGDTKIDGAGGNSQLLTVIVAESNQGIAASQEQAAQTPEAEFALLVDFQIVPETQPIVIERGKTVSVPLKVIAPNDAEKTLNIMFGPPLEGVEPEVFDARLSDSTVTLSKGDVENGIVENLGGNMGARHAGTLTLTAPADMSPGEYRIMIEVVQQIDSEVADALFAGKIITIHVK